SPAAERVGATVITIWAASSAVFWRRVLRAITRWTSPHVTSIRATTSKLHRRPFILRGACCFGLCGKDSAMRELHWVCGVHRSAAVDDRKDRRHKNQRCDGREYQPADHGAPEGRV